eukprot:719771_1
MATKSARREAIISARCMNILCVLDQCTQNRWGDVRRWREAWDGFVSGWNCVATQCYSLSHTTRVHPIFGCSDLQDWAERLQLHQLVSSNENYNIAPKDVPLIYAIDSKTMSSNMIRLILQHLVAAHNGLLRLYCELKGDDCGSLPQLSTCQLSTECNTD